MKKFADEEDKQQKEVPSLSSLVIGTKLGESIVETRAVNFIN